MITLFLSLFVIASIASPLIVHEWGTFTSVQGSNGKPLAGSHHGEEPLPGFIHSRADTFTHEMWQSLQDAQDNARVSKRATNGIVPPPEIISELKQGINCGFCKVMDWIPTFNTTREVTQKLETPVIYFYSPKKINNVKVTVDFPQGIVTEVYPETSLNLPRVGKVDSVAEGHAEWVVNVAERDAQLDIPEVEEDSIWAPSRRVSSNSVTNVHNQESERHIFYRGLGRFEGPVSITSNFTHVTVQNNDNEAIDAAWVLSRNGDNGFLHRLPKINSKSSVSFEISQLHDKNNILDRHTSLDNYLAAASVSLEVELMKSGLYQLEARAMVDTWSNSYFKNEGLRVLYITPSNYPNTLLPWNIVPKPIEEKRVLVGRVEILLKSEEGLLNKVMNIILSHYQSLPEKERKVNSLLKTVDTYPVKVAHAYEYIWSLGRFAESKVRRVLEGSLGSKFASPLIEEWILSTLTY